MIQKLVTSIPIVVTENKRPRRQRWLNEQRRQQRARNKIKPNSAKRQFKQRSLQCGASKNARMKNLWFLNLTVLFLLFAGQWLRCVTCATYTCAAHRTLSLHCSILLASGCCVLARSLACRQKNKKTTKRVRKAICCGHRKCEHEAFSMELRTKRKT